MNGKKFDRARIAVEITDSMRAELYHQEMKRRRAFQRKLLAAGAPPANFPDQELELA